MNLINIDIGRLYGVPEELFIWCVDNYWAPGYYNVKLVGGPNFGKDKAKAYIDEKLQLLRNEGTYPIHQYNIIKFASHTPVTMFVSAEEIRRGFYRQLYNLQGLNNTFWTGATWASDYSTLL